jgi:hypothetical protein
MEKHILITEDKVAIKNKNAFIIAVNKDNFRLCKIKCEDAHSFYNFLFFFKPTNAKQYIEKTKLRLI